MNKIVICDSNDIILDNNSDWSYWYRPLKGEGIDLGRGSGNGQHCLFNINNQGDRHNYGGVLSFNPTIIVSAGYGDGDGYKNGTG